MIAIVNVSKIFGQGLQDYEVRINYVVKARFQHVREEGLAKCLRLAADAIDAQLVDDIIIKFQDAQKSD